ncbi:uncharacterized protein C8R40DRAFT_1074379 [Lentinula edodes]|uniref:uncharacterized protein n=1 Tax=Lentinula edodes TaxID=5353 RepID=UPI001E8E3465|nr:uncharacterized protein C8R40DRAFT_1074379 [Lentinula edodes]KAH7869040.1 hypothetical protein C8R40DRAFT_1074379 [Lentinula edodes]
MTDLSLPLASEKSPLPAIIVTPSSPSSAHDYSIAFLAPPKEPGFFERLGARLHWTKAAAAAESNPNASFGVGLRAQTARTLLILFLILFVMLTHVVTHRMAQTSRRPHLDFSVQDSSPAPVAASYVLGEIGVSEGMDGLSNGSGGVDQFEGFEGTDSVPSSAMEGGHRNGFGGVAQGHGHRHAHGGWFDLSRYWGDDQEEEDEKRDFIVFA